MTTVKLVQSTCAAILWKGGTCQRRLWAAEALQLTAQDMLLSVKFRCGNISCPKTSDRLSLVAIFSWDNVAFFFTSLWQDGCRVDLVYSHNIYLR